MKSDDCRREGLSVCMERAASDGEREEGYWMECTSCLELSEAKRNESGAAPGERSDPGAGERLCDGT